MKTLKLRLEAELHARSAPDKEELAQALEQVAANIRAMGMDKATTGLCPRGEYAYMTEIS